MNSMANGGTGTEATEDKTFRMLGRRSFEEANAAWHNSLRNSSVQYAIEALKELGWTKDEFFIEWAKRNRNWEL